jgi:hypothetical protein
MAEPFLQSGVVIRRCPYFHLGPLRVAEEAEGAH